MCDTFVDAPLPDTGPVPAGTCDASTLFWQHEVLHRVTLQNYVARSKLYQEERTI